MSLVCTDVRALYGGFVAVDGVSLSVEGGHILGVAGPNGAGKTTLFDVLSGYHKADSGRVELNGARHHEASRSPARPPRPCAHVPVADRADRPDGRRDARGGADRLVAEARLEKRCSPPGRWRGSRRRTTVRCGGLDTLDRRKLLLTCVLMRKPSVLLLDEPCSGLMQDEIDEMDAIIREVTAETGMAVVVVEHRLELLHAVAETVLVMDAGKVIAEGPPATVFDDPVVRAAYFDAPQAA